MRKLTEEDIAALTGTVHKGYTIKLARVKEGEFCDSDHYGIAFGQHINGNCVTWQFHLDGEDEEVSFYWGHYIDDPKAALVDYRTRR